MTGGSRASLSTSKPITATAAGLSLWPSHQARRSWIHTGATHPASGMYACHGEDPSGLPLRRQPDPQGDAPLKTPMIQTLQRQVPDLEERDHPASKSTSSGRSSRPTLPICGPRTSNLLCCPKRVDRFRTRTLPDAHSPISLSTNENFSISHI